MTSSKFSRVILPLYPWKRKRITQAEINKAFSIVNPSALSGTLPVGPKHGETQPETVELKEDQASLCRKWFPDADRDEWPQRIYGRLLAAGGEHTLISRMSIVAAIEFLEERSPRLDDGYDNPEHSGASHPDNDRNQWLYDRFDKHQLPELETMLEKENAEWALSKPGIKSAVKDHIRRNNLPNKTAPRGRPKNR